MIPKIYDKYRNYIGELPFCTRGYVIEERNGMFELELDYRLNYTNYEYLVRGNIIEVDANDKQKNQIFRIYKVTKDIMGQFTVYANHISYDIARDYTEGLNITNQSCEYCLNQLFRNSQFSRGFRGVSDIVSAQDFNIGNTNLLLAISGTSGSILDTFGNGAEILRDNYIFHVLNKRGQDNGVTIEYASNLTGLDYEEDDTSLITRIRAIARYTPEAEEGQESEEQVVRTYVDSPLIGEYETPFIGEVDFSSRFEEGEVPTTSKLQTLAVEYFNKNKCDRVKFSYKVSFIPLSKCVGYEGIEDRIDLCDTVRIIDSRYNLDTQAKVIKVTYDFLRDRYDSMELGEPRTSLGDIVGGNTEEPPAGPKGEKGDKGEPGAIGDFPDELPTTPVISCKLYGFASIELSWTFENKPYYTYELFASKTQGFTPNEFDLIHEGQSSSFLYQARPNETWYFRVCGKNSYGNRTSFSEEVSVTTTKIDDLANYVGEMAIGEALIGELSLDRGWVGQLNASLLDVKGNFSVTDGNGKRTLDIDSFGNVYLDVSQLQINSSTVPTKDEVERSIASIKIDSEKIDFLVEKGSTSSNMKLTAEAIKMISDNIDLTGKVTFNSLGGGLKDQIDSTSEIVDKWIYEDVETQQTLIDGGFIKTGSITTEKLAAGAIAVDLLKSNNENPIIRLFSECALDATEKNGKGQGKAIRLKWDDYNYIYIGEDTTQFYQGSGGESSIFTITGDTSDTYLSNYGGKCILMLSADKEGYINDDLILTSKNFKEYCAEADHDHDKVYAQLEHWHEEYADAEHEHSDYATTEYVDDAINNLGGSGGGGGGGGSCDACLHYVEEYSEGGWIEEFRFAGMLVPQSYIYDGDPRPLVDSFIMVEQPREKEYPETFEEFLTPKPGYFMDFALRHLNNSADGDIEMLFKYDEQDDLPVLGPSSMSFPIDLGSPNWGSCKRWKTIYAENSLNTCDKKYKENIMYIDEILGTQTYDSRNEEPETPFLDFIKNDFRPALYNYKPERNMDIRQQDNQIGFIANDIIDTEIGSTFLYDFGKDGEQDIMFSTTGYTTVVAKALQEEIQTRDKKIEELESRLELLENKLNELLNKGQE